MITTPLLLALTLGSPSAAALAPAPLLLVDDEACASIRMGDIDASFEERLRAGGSIVIVGLLERVVDRLESRQCYARSLKLLGALDQRIDELLEADATLAELRARIELITARIELRRSCPALECGTTCGTQLLTDYLDVHSELGASTVEGWLLAEQDDPEALRCVLDDALAERDVPREEDKDPPPPLLPPSTTDTPPDTTEPGPGTDRPSRLAPTWSAKQRSTAIALSSVGMALGIATMIAGGVFLGIDERCPYGQEPDECERRYSTLEEGVIGMTLGTVALAGSSVGLSVAVLRQPAAEPDTSARAWAFGLGWSGTF